MKNKVIVFIIGILVGAIIATGAFYIYNKKNDSCECGSNNTQINEGQPPEMPNGQNGEMGEPPEKPDGEMGEPPEKPNDNNSQNSN